MIVACTSRVKFSIKIVRRRDGNGAIFRERPPHRPPAKRWCGIGCVVRVVDESLRVVVQTTPVSMYGIRSSDDLLRMLRR